MKDKSVKVGIAVGILAVFVTPLLMLAAILWDGFWFMNIWNLLMPKFGLFQMSLVLAIAINLIIGYHKISSYKNPNKFSISNVIVSPIIIWIAAFILSKFI